MELSHQGQGSGTLCLGEKCRYGSEVSEPREPPEGRKCSVQCPYLLTFLPVVDVPLDVDTATKHLIISEDLRSVWRGFTSSRRSRDLRGSPHHLRPALPAVHLRRHSWRWRRGPAEGTWASAARLRAGEGRLGRLRARLPGREFEKEPCSPSAPSLPAPSGGLPECRGRFLLPRWRWVPYLYIHSKFPLRSRCVCFSVHSIRARTTRAS